MESVCIIESVVESRIRFEAVATTAQDRLDGKQYVWAKVDSQLVIWIDGKQYVWAKADSQLVIQEFL